VIREPAVRGGVLGGGIVRAEEGSRNTEAERGPVRLDAVESERPRPPAPFPTTSCTWRLSAFLAEA
jgi:hypothetical protein